MTASRLMLILALASAVPACRDADTATQAAPAPAPSATSDTPRKEHGVRLDASQIKQVRIDELSMRPSASTIKATGTVEFNADRTAKVLPPVAGQVQNLSRNVGDAVHRNDVLFVLSSREVAAAVADHVASHKDVDLAEKTFAMTQDLYEHQAASRIALQQSENELAKAKSRLLQTEEVLQVLGVEDRHDDAMQVQPRIPVRAPIDGTVIERSVTTGQFVGPDTAAPLFTIADLSHVWVQADIFERDLRSIAIGQKADVTTAAYPADRFGAQVSRIAPIVDAQTRTAKVRFLVANPGARLKPGMFASISLYLADTTSSLTVPVGAVFVENGRTFAYVQIGAQEFARREVETSPSGSERVKILRGLSAGERVVSQGVLLLRQLEADSSQ